MQRRKINSYVTWVVYYVFASFCCIIMLLPFLWTLSTSLKDFRDTFKFPPDWIPRSISWGNYLAAWKLVPFPRCFFNSIFVSTSAALLTLIVCSMAAYAFARMDFPGRSVLFLIYLSTMMIPSAVTLIPSFVIVKKLGWINNYAGLIIPPALGSVGFSTFLLRQFFISIPKELEEAAIIDGCNQWKAYLNIILPLSKSALAIVGLYMVIGNWNNLLWALVVITKEEMKTLTLALATLTAADLYVPPWNQLMAATIIAILPIMIAFAFTQRFFIKSITLSGLKG